MPLSGRHVVPDFTISEHRALITSGRRPKFFLLFSTHYSVSIDLPHVERHPSTNDSCSTNSIFLPDSLRHLGTPLPTPYTAYPQISQPSKSPLFHLQRVDRLFDPIARQL